MTHKKHGPPMIDSPVASTQADYAYEGDDSKMVDIDTEKKMVDYSPPGDKDPKDEKELNDKQKKKKWINDWITQQELKWGKEKLSEDEKKTRLKELESEIKEFNKNGPKVDKKSGYDEWKKAFLKQFIPALTYDYKHLPMEEPPKLEMMEEVDAELESPFKDVIVYVDAGHGGIDPGATSRIGKRHEDDITLIVSNYVKADLANLGFDARATRETEEHNPGSSNKERLAWRAALSRQANAHIFVSIHVNAVTSPQPDYLSVITQKTDDPLQISLDLQSDLVKSLQEGVDGGSITSKQGVKAKEQNLHVTREQNDTTAAILVEIGFLSNPTQAELFEDDNYLKAIADAISSGITNYSIKLISK